MRRKQRQLHQRDNVIAFPGMYEKLVSKGVRYVDCGEYAQAVEAFDQAMYFSPLGPDFLGPYSVALYETKDYHRAKEMTSLQLHSGAAEYPEVLEMYTTICIQLGEYEEADILLDTVMEAGLVPVSMMPKFTYLRELNARMSKRYPQDELPEPDPPFTFDEFVAADDAEQQGMLAAVEWGDAGTMTDVLVDIVESVNFSPFIITVALTLLYQADYEEAVTIRKFGEETTVIPQKLLLPGHTAQTQEVRETLEGLLDKDPSRLEMAYNLVEKFNITAYPFTWGDYEAEEIATAYVAYIESLFSETELPDTPLCQWIVKVDKESDFGKS